MRKYLSLLTVFLVLTVSVNTVEAANAQYDLNNPEEHVFVSSPLGGLLGIHQ
jgi:putative cell wall-binding protein